MSEIKPVLHRLRLTQLLVTACKKQLIYLKGLFKQHIYILRVMSLNEKCNDNRHVKDTQSKRYKL